MLPNPVYHQVAFAGIMASSIIRAGWLINQLPAERRGKLTRTLVTGVGWFILGETIHCVLP